MRIFKSTNLVAFLALSLGFFLIASGCAKPPTQEIADAEAAITAARDAGAEDYATEEFRSAEKLLAQAQSEVDDEAYREAKTHAIQAKEKADMAREITLRATGKPAAAPVAVRGELSAYHIVEKGECLWRISEYEDIYNDPFQWPLIYKANRGKINDPDLIHPEQNFSIPRDSSESEVAEAVREAKFRGAWSLWDGK